MFKFKIPCALTIAGSDSGGGAGISADLKTFSALNVHGLCAITSVTAQNTVGVHAIFDLPLKMIEKQIDVVVNDIGVDSAKTGMLNRKETIKMVSKKIKQYNIPTVVDPVMIAASGAPLLRPDAVDFLKNDLFPVAKIVTPNLFEAEKLSKIKILNLNNAKQAAKKIAQFGPEAVLIKGGHARFKEAIDVLYFGKKFYTFKSERIETKNLHGAGCTYSAAIAAELAKGKNLVESIASAKELITNAIKFGLEIGHGPGPVNPTAFLHNEAEKYKIIRNLKEAIRILQDCKNFVKLIPEVGTNIAMALPYAKNLSDVAAIPGRIVRFKDHIKIVGDPEFGGSKHVATIVLTAMKFDPLVRAAINIYYSESILKTCQRMKLYISTFDRTKEPKEVETMKWGTQEAIKNFRGIPNVIYDLGAVGKEPMIRILGKSAVEVAGVAAKIAEALK